MPANPPGTEPTHKITDQQEHFCQAYSADIHRNGTKAAIAAGYSENTAQEQSSDLLSRPIIRARVNELLFAQFEALQLEAKTVIKELLQIATVDIADAYNENGTMKSIHDMPILLRKAIASIETKELYEGTGENRELTGYTKSIKLWDKPKAAELLGKHLKLFVDITEIPGISDLAKRLEEANKRVPPPPSRTSSPGGN